jgi:hypothetical protein
MTTPNSLVQPGKGTCLNHGRHKEFPGDLSERWPGLRVPSANRLVVWGRKTMVMEEP